MKNITIMLLLCLSTALSAQELITDRPDQTESSATVPKGSLQIESGMLLGFTTVRGVSERQILAPTSLFRLGIIKGLELRLLSQFESLKFVGKSEGINGISDLEIGTKIQILQKEGVKTEIALLSHLVVPTGSRELTLDEYGSINKLCISHDLGGNIDFGYNVGYSYFGTGKGDLTYSIAFGIGVTDKVSVYIEPYGDMEEFDEHISSFDAGLTYLINDNVQLDFSFGTGLNHEMNYLSFGVSWLIFQKEAD